MDADEHFFLKLQEGYRMEKPKYAPKKLYEVMVECWARDPLSRPDFAALSETLGAQLESSVRRHYIDLNDSYVQANRAGADGATDYLAMMSPVDYVNVGGAAGHPSPMPPRHSATTGYVNIPTNVQDSDRYESALLKS